MRIAGERENSVEQDDGLLAARDGVQHRAEEGHSVDVNGRGPDIVADRVHALVVALAYLLVVGLGVRRLGELGRQPDVGQGLAADLVEVLYVLPVVLSVPPAAEAASGGTASGQAVPPAPFVNASGFAFGCVPPSGVRGDRVVQ